jgi:hypothetical protein
VSEKFQATKTLGLGGINVMPERLRTLRPEVVKELAESINHQGLINPITFRSGQSSSGIRAPTTEQSTNQISNSVTIADNDQTINVKNSTNNDH